jgi:HEAT repeat protein
MDGTCGKWFLTLACCFLAPGAAGCTNCGGLCNGWPFPKRVASDLPDVPSPAERIAALRELADEARRTPVEQKHQIARQLAEAIRTEEDPLIREEIIRTLGVYPGPGSDAVLRSALEDPEPEVRAVACEAWGARGDEEAVALLSGVLDGDLDTDVRLAAARALGQSRNSAAVAALGRGLEDKDPAIQYRCVLSLERVTGKDLGNDVNHWRQYVAGELPRSAAGASLAERLRGILTF